MAKAKTFRVISGRIHFKCSACQAKRMVAIPPQVRSRSIRCHRCGEITRGNFNRRVTPREQQRGKVLVSTSDGTYVEVDLYDISPHGIGFDVSPRDIRKMIVGKEIQLRCTWNPRLFLQGHYVIRSIKGRRIGVQRT